MAQKWNREAETPKLHKYAIENSDETSTLGVILINKLLTGVLDTFPRTLPVRMGFLTGNNRSVMLRL